MAHRDPFQNTPDVSAYVARPATEEALASLLSAVRTGERLVALQGPAGIGKTFLGHVLAERCRQDLQIVHVPVPSLLPEGLYGWVLATIGISAGAEPRARLIEEARKASEDGLPLFVSIDDADSMPDDTAIALRELHAELASSLRLLFTVGDDAAGARHLELLGPDVARVRLDQLMSSAETAVYLHARLAYCEASREELTRFDPDAIEQLYRVSNGLPSAVNELADELIRPEEAALSRSLDSDLRPETLAFALLTEAEGEQRMTDEELVRVVASRGSSRADSAVPAPLRPGRANTAEAIRASAVNAGKAATAGNTGQGGSNALLGTARPISVEPPAPSRTGGFANFLQTLTPDLVAGTGSNPLEEIESLVEARLQADSENDRVDARSSLPELPDLPAQPPSGELATSILSALAQPFDSNGELRPMTENAVESPNEAAAATATDAEMDTGAEVAVTVEAGHGPEEIAITETPEPIEPAGLVRHLLRSNVEEAPEAERAPAPRPASNPVADRILGALRHPTAPPRNGAIAAESSDGGNLIREVLHVDVESAVEAAAPEASGEPTTIDVAVSDHLLNFEPEAFEPFEEAVSLEGSEAPAEAAAPETVEPAAEIEMPDRDASDSRDTVSFLAEGHAPVAPAHSVETEAAVRSVKLPELPAADDGFEAGGYDFSGPPPPLPSFELPRALAHRAEPPTAASIEDSVLLPRDRVTAASPEPAPAAGHGPGPAEDSVLLPYVAPPTYSGSDSILLDSSPPAPRGRVGQRGGADGGDKTALEDLAPSNASLRSLGVFDGGRSSERYPKHSGLTSSEPMAELAGEIAREAEARRGLRTEIVALAAGVALFAAGTLVYWAATPPTIVRSPAIYAPAAEIADAGVLSQTAEASLAAPEVAAAMAVAKAQPAARSSVATAASEIVEPAPSTGLSFWPPLETETAAVVAESGAEAAPITQQRAPELAAVAAPVVAESTPGSASSDETGAVAALPATTAPAPPAATQGGLEVAPLEGGQAEDVLELAPVEVATAGFAGAIAGQRPPASIAAPALGARVLPVTVRAPAGMVIQVDGVERGVAPMFGLLLSEGTHRVVATTPSGDTNEQLFEVNESNLEVLFDAPGSR